MLKFKFKFFTIALLAIAAFVSTNCSSNSANINSTTSGGVDPNETAATVNGKAIKLEEVERVIKQQGQGQEVKLSPLELAQARLQVLETLIQNEVLFQKAEKEGTVPKDEDVTVEFNKQKTASGLSAEQFNAKMKEIGETDATAREAIKKRLAIEKLIDNVTGKIEPPKDSEIEAFYNGNKDAFVKKRGVKLAAIVVDPANNGEGDTTKNEADATLKIKEIQQQLMAANGANFSQVASEKSEDPSKIKGGELGYVSEDELKQNFSSQVAQAFMDEKFPVGNITPPLSVAGKYYIFKLQERNNKEEAQTLETPGVRQQITDSLINARKQLLSASYAAMAMNDAQIENYLAKKVVENPNELSGARPASAETPQTEAGNNANTNVNSNINANANVNTKPQTKPSANTNTK
ncbi:hypothetical protein BH24ACI2_BH24ACI2_15920 [soil metagenome]|nr:SurA N-terminal domain-containing protein [Acidobacteriota bacterium]